MSMISLDSKYTIHPTTGCWEWNKPGTDGYGHIRIRSRGMRRVFQAHRVMWEMHHGFTSAEHVHHRCENRRCVNPDHLEPMTHKENNRLAYSTFTKGECRRGHTNLRTRPNGRHYCRTCNTERMRKVRNG